MTATVTATQYAPSQKVDIRQIIGFSAMVFGMFMALLDIQIVSASLSEIQAGLSSSREEASWVQTSYLIAEVIMIPLSGFLGRLLSTRTLFTISAIGFTVASVLCATATSIQEMIVYRALQGFLGGGMIPSVYAAAFTIFPISKNNIVSPLIGLVATFAPTIGPTLGGYISYNLSWHWLFLVNLVPGIIVTILAWKYINFDKGDRKLFAQFNWIAFIFMAICLGGVQYVLEEGPRKDWFESSVIETIVIISTLAGILFFWRNITSKNKIIDFTTFKNISFCFGSFFSFIMGIGLYGLTYLYPLYLSEIRGYDTLMIGQTMFVSGLTMFLFAPLSGYVATKIDLRLMMLIGCTGFAIGTWIVTGLTAEWDFWQIFWPQVLRGSSLLFCMVPINNIALGTIAPDKLKNASAIFNLLRNLGGAIGLALINTQIIKRSDFYYQRIAETLHAGNTQAMEFFDKLAVHFGTVDNPSDVSALLKISEIVRQQAMVMAFIEIFLLLTFLFATIGVIVMFLKLPARKMTEES